jgi:hypothetical protein
MRYIERLIDKEIREKLSSAGAIVIRGPKWCGKTTSAKQVANSVLEMQDPDLHDNYLELANTKPSLLLEGDKPRLIDEWQVAPKLWNAVRHSVDKESKPSQYILTGSATPIDDNTMHSGTGRFAFVTMKPMTLFESGESTGSVSLTELLAGNTEIDGLRTELTYESIAQIICRGGWPNAVVSGGEGAISVAANYLDLLCESDISKVDGVKRNPTLARTILKSYARHVSTINSNKSLYDDVRANYSEVSNRTIIDYIDTFKRLYVVEETEAWNPNIRSKTSMRAAPKKSMVDPSLAAAALECSPKELMFDTNTYGLLFENLVNRDLSVYVNSINGSLKHYRDRFGLECDNVANFRNGKFALIEVKLSGSRIKEAESHLLKLQKLIIENEPILGAPAFLMVVTGTDMAYTTENGVFVVPVGCLKQ